MSAADLPRLAGYAAIFDIPDADRDVIRRGAFEHTLAMRCESLPLLWEHRPSSIIGTVEFAREDHRGLRIIARLTEPGHRARHLLGGGQVSGLSFGYRAREARHGNAGRELLALDLFEISLVSRPLHNAARVHLVR